MKPLIPLLALGALPACEKPDWLEPDPPRRNGAETETETAVPESGVPETGSESETEETETESEPPPVDYDCSAPVVDPPTTVMNDARAYHGIAFDDDGNLIGWDGMRSIMRSPYSGTAQLFVPGITYVEQFDRLADGDFVLSEGQRISRLSPEGALTTLASNNRSWAYGVTVGPDGNVYTADGNVNRIDLETGLSTVFVELPRTATAHSLDFNLDSTMLYIGTIGRGTLYGQPLDEELIPVGELVELAQVGSGWHDAVAVDACGDIWVPDYYTSDLYMVDGETFEVTTYRATSREYGHGAEFGTGVGGWRADALYQPLPYNGSTVKEVVIGRPSGITVRTWNGVPQQIP